MSDRSNKPPFAVSRNLKHAKYHFIEAITDKLTESSNTTPNSVSTSTWLCVTFNMISTSLKTWQTSLLFLELLQIQNLKRKSGGHRILCPPCPPPNCAHAYHTVQVRIFHDGCKQGIDQQIFNRKLISRKITHPQS